MRSLLNMTDPEIRQYLAMLGEATESIMPAGPSNKGRALFLVLVFDDPGMAHYVSNCDRGTVVHALRETADRLERQEDER
jgi:hypothetical protein